jgi:arabinogalactan endo-1,4-beta-galactosidase
MHTARTWLAGIAILVILIGCTPVTTPTPMPTPTAIPEPASLVNPSFEESMLDGNPPGWDNTGIVEAVLLEGRGHTGDFRLTHMATEAYQVDTTQVATGLANDWYTLRAWMRSSGGQNEVYIALQCGGEETRVNVPSTSPGYRWIQLVVSNLVVDHQCTIRLHSDGNPDTWASFDDIELVPGRAVLPILGADISSLTKSEAMGGIYRYRAGHQGDALQIMKDSGLNYARLRVWVDSADGYHGKDELLAMASRLKALDIKLLVDFHYSDTWADPGKQYKPAAWEDYDFEQLTQAVYDHTYDVCSSLVAQGTPPDMVQLGNEISAGMLWPDGDYNHFDNLAALLKAGHQAVKDSSPSTLVMLHIPEGGDNELAKWWFGNITRRDVPFDVIGISYYPFWHGTLAELQSNLNDISARYDKDVIVVETAYPFTPLEDDSLANIVSKTMVIPGWPFTPEGQRLMLRDLMAVVRAVPDGRGLGVFWWDATWTAVPGNGWDPADPDSGNGWENQALFDYQGRALPALDEYLYP